MHWNGGNEGTSQSIVWDAQQSIIDNWTPVPSIEVWWNTLPTSITSFPGHPKEFQEVEIELIFWDCGLSKKIGSVLAEKIFWFRFFSSKFKLRVVLWILPYGTYTYNSYVDKYQNYILFWVSRLCRRCFDPSMGLPLSFRIDHAIRTWRASTYHRPSYVSLQ